MKKMFIVISLVLATFISTSIGATETVPTEDVSLNYGEIKSSSAKSKARNTGDISKKDENIKRDGTTSSSKGGVTGADRRRASPILDD